MDCAAGQRNSGEAAATVMDLVTFKKKGAHGERGLVVNPPEQDTPEDDKLAVLCVDGAVVYVAGDLAVVDRSDIRPGEIVVSASDSGGQIGVVTKATTSLDLVQLGNGVNDEPVARGVSPSELRRVREFSIGDYVVFGPWLGRVIQVSVDVDVLFDDGAICRIADADGNKLEVIDGSYVRAVMNTSFYPGQRVVEGTVVKVDMGAVLVYWVASAKLGTNRDIVKASAPPAFQKNPNNLTLFASSDDCFWGVGDRCFFRNPCKNELYQKQTKLGRRARRRADHKRKPVEIMQPMSVADIRTTVDVLWQNGTRQCGVPSASLLPFEVLNDNEFFPGQRVISRASIDVSDGVDKKDLATAAGGADADDKTAGPAAPYGIVRSLDVRDQTVRVCWFKTAERGSEVECDETVSAYDLDNDDYVFYGNVVVRLRMLQTASRSTSEPVQSSKRTAITHDLSWVGHVIDLCNDGRVQVKWGDGITSKVLRHEISIVEEHTIDEMKMEMGDWVANNDAVVEAQDDTDEDIAAAAASAAGNVTAGNGDDSANMSGGEAGAAVVSGITQGLIHLAAEVQSKDKRLLVCDPEATPSSEPAATENIVQHSNYGDGSETMVVKGDVDGNVCAMEKSAENVVTRGDDNLICFPNFDVVHMSPPDHFFLKDTEQGIDGANKWIKRLQKEWKILENDLPDTIYVRAFEDRMDLLRVAMVGAAGTPYQDGLFFFDLQLPPTFPAVPPLVHYHSFGLNLNPNLDESGTVCLSLLDTFGGEDVELWSPEMSSVLQVVVSIQGLVLTAQPFYNESAYEEHHGTAQAARNEVVYAEDACLLTLRTMLHLLRRAPAGFEELVRRHFRRRGRFVLRACEAYLRKGLPVGTLDAEARATEVGSGHTCSAGFRLALTRFMPRLVEVFTSISADGCEQFDTSGPPCTPTVKH